jgi:hypothetical protein
MGVDEEVEVEEVEVEAVEAVADYNIQTKTQSVEGQVCIYI